MSCILLAGLYSTRINFCCLSWLTSSPELLGEVMDLLGGSWSLGGALQIIFVPAVILLFCQWLPTGHLSACSLSDASPEQGLGRQQEAESRSRSGAECR